MHSVLLFLRPDYYYSEYKLHTDTMGKSISKVIKGTISRIAPDAVVI